MIAAPSRKTKSQIVVSGAADGRFLDARKFEPILAQAETQDVPIDLHPGIPTAPVSPADRTKIAHGNADCLLRLPV